MARRSKYLGSISIRADVEVDLNDVLDDIDDATLEKAGLRRASEPTGLTDFDLLEELHWQLSRGKVQAALAMIESAQNAARVTDERRQLQYQLAGKAH